MFSTFTGNSRRPRTINLSGQAGNPFANTSWTPSAASNATKTVSDAQAEREKRQAERQRLRAAGKIQRTWRGHRARRTLAASHRAAFDELYSSFPSPRQRLPTAFTLLLSFYSPRSSEDVRRVSTFARDFESVDFDHIAPQVSHSSRLIILADILVQALTATTSHEDSNHDSAGILKLILRLMTHAPHSLRNSLGSYYKTLASLFRRESMEGKDLLVQALIGPLNCASEEDAAYAAFAADFLTSRDLSLLEQNTALFSSSVDIVKLATAIQSIYQNSRGELPSRQDLSWLLAHFIGLGRASLDKQSKGTQINALLIQLTYLSPYIGTRINLQPSQKVSGDDNDTSGSQPFEPFISDQLLSLVDHKGISDVLRDFSSNLADPDASDPYATSLLAGYILHLLHCFPTHADETRMRLFLEQIPTPSGPVPTCKFLWQIMRQTSVFVKLHKESEQPLIVIRRYLHGSSHSPQASVEDQEWRVVLLFLELYTFTLRLSDDEDFFSGINSQLTGGNASTSRLHQCSLSLVDVEALSIFLKNAAFVLHYRARELSPSHVAVNPSEAPREDSSSGSADTSQGFTNTDFSSAASTKLDLDGLRTMITTVLTMLYERDSRQHFLPPNHWLMSTNLEQEDFINAVIVEEERQVHEAEAESEDEGSTDDRYFYEDAASFATHAGQRLSRHARMERLKSQQIRLQRERRLAEMGPKLEILKHMPFVVPFETRVQILRQFIYLDRARREGDIPFYMVPAPPHFLPRSSARYRHHTAKIKRGQLFEDAFEQFYGIGDGLKDGIQITFVDKFDTPEAGIDGGGVTKEFLLGVTTEAFGNGGRDNGGMFISNEQGLLFPDPTALDTLRESLRQRGLVDSDAEWRDAVVNLLRRFEFLGRVIGKCLYEGILVDLAFAGFFLLKWPSSGPKDENSYKGSINDLRDMDEELYKGLLRLKNYAGDVSELGFDFTVTDRISPPGQPVKTITRNLIANGDQTPVTNDNRLLYTSYAARHRLVVQPMQQTTAFLRGLRSIIRPSWLSMFNQTELQRLVGGDSSEIDIDDLRRNTVYSGLYVIGDDDEEHPTIKLFWKVMASFTDSQKRDVLKYVSSTPRAPLLGFSQLRPKFSIRDGGTDEERLPSTSTCVNLLKLPRYTTEATLRDKLLYAVTSGAGFDLS